MPDMQEAHAQLAEFRNTSAKTITLLENLLAHTDALIRQVEAAEQETAAAKTESKQFQEAYDVERSAHTQAEEAARFQEARAGQAEADVIELQKAVELAEAHHADAHIPPPPNPTPREGDEPPPPDENSEFVKSAEPEPEPDTAVALEDAVAAEEAPPPKA